MLISGHARLLYSSKNSVEIWELLALYNRQLQSLYAALLPVRQNSSHESHHSVMGAHSSHNIRFKLHTHFLLIHSAFHVIHAYQSLQQDYVRELLLPQCT